MLGLQTKEAGNFKRRNKKGNRQQLYHPQGNRIDMAWVTIDTSPFLFGDANNEGACFIPNL